MTVSNETKRSPNYVCNNSVTNFSVPFYILDETHIAVYLLDTTLGTQTLLTLTTHYTVNNVGVPAGSDIDTVATYASGYEIVIIRAVPFTQLKDYIDHDTFPAESHEQGLDKLTMLLQQQQEALDRCIKFVESAQDSDVLIPNLDGEAGKALIVNPAEDAFLWHDLANLSIYIVSALSQTLLALTTEAAWIAQLSTKLSNIDLLTWSTDRLLQFTGADTVAAKLIADFGQLAVAGSWSAAQAYSADALSISTGTVGIDFATNGVKTLTLTENVSVNAPSNLAIDRCVILVVTQDGTGGRTLSFNAGYDFAGNDSVVNATASAKTIYWLYSPDGTTISALKIWEDD